MTFGHLLWFDNILPKRVHEIILTSEVLREYRKKANSKKNPWGPGNIDLLLDVCKNIIGKEQFNEVFTGKDSIEQFRQLILLPPEQLENLATKIQEWLKQKDTNKKEFEKTNIQRLKVVYTDGKIMGKKIDGRKINSLMVEQLSIFVCPYCNRNYINTRIDKKDKSKSSLGAQMDHFYSKDKYPIFAVCLYNFIPVCGVCNNIKRTTDFKVYPFLKDKSNEHEVVFNYQYKTIDRIEPYFKSSEDRKADMDAIKLGEAYGIHDLDIQNMLEREERYSHSYRQELRNILTVKNDIGNTEFQLSLTDDEIDRMIYGDSVFEEDIKNISLGKFKKDIYHEIKRLRDY